MEQVFLKIESNENIADGIYEMRLSGNVPDMRPGQFVNIKIDGCYLRRPISVCDSDGNSLTVIYKVVGKGTETLSGVPSGNRLDILAGLGNGFDLSASGQTPVLVGGGVGVPPLYKLCKELIKEGKTPTAILGFNSAKDVFYKEKFEETGAKVYIMTADGTTGERGLVTDKLLNIPYSYFYACGPKAMFRAMEKIVSASGEYSFEEKMGCGFGACMGCSVMTKSGGKRVCREGPVFKREEIIW